MCISGRSFADLIEVLGSGEAGQSIAELRWWNSVILAVVAEQP